MRRIGLCVGKFAGTKAAVNRELIPLHKIGREPDTATAPQKRRANRPAPPDLPITTC